IEVGVSPRTHGSALFTRGQTQALSVTALGTLKEEMRLDTLGLETKKYYWHHYNFPPFSVGEAGRIGGVKRRDIGHGALAERGLTALQMDIKISGVTFEILRDALTQANGARKSILADMAAVIGSPREQLSQFAPRIQTIQIDPSQIGLLIGKGGETIRALSEEFESQIDVNDDGQVLIYSANGELADALVERVRMMLKEVEVGDEYVGKVVKTTTFGAFIELAKGTDGLLHISNVSPGERVESVEDVLSRGDEVNVRVVEVDRERGRIGLRLAHDPDIAGKSAEELAGVGTGGGPRPVRDGARRNGRERD